MNLIRALADSPLRWTLTVGEVPAKRTNAMVRRLVLTVVRTPGEEPIVMHFREEAGHTPEAMLAAFLGEHDPQNPVLAQWRVSRGEVAVTLESYALESLGEAIHTALRKLADSKQSVITWNALHHIHPDDRVAAWDAARTVLTEAFSSGAAVKRRTLAMALRDAVISALDNASIAPPANHRGEVEKRSDAEKFALRMLIAGCEMTELDEWMWGWLGYVVKDAAATAVAA